MELIGTFADIQIVISENDLTLLQVLWFLSNLYIGQLLQIASLRGGFSSISSNKNSMIGKNSDSSQTPLWLKTITSYKISQNISRNNHSKLKIGTVLKLKCNRGTKKWQISAIRRKLNWRSILIIFLLTFSLIDFVQIESLTKMAYPEVSFGSTRR